MSCLFLVMNRPEMSRFRLRRRMFTKTQHRSKIFTFLTKAKKSNTLFPMAFMSLSKPVHKSSKIQPLKTCRICFCEDNQLDILSNICGCRGSLAHVHRSCIKEWILSSTEFSISITREEKIYCRTCQIRLQTSKIFIPERESPSPTTGCCSWLTEL